MTFSLSQIAAVVGAPAPIEDHPVQGWSVDTRTLQPGDLFFALKGPNHDGHDFISIALDKGAFVIASSIAAPHPRVLLVNDTQVALETLASWARTQWGKPLVAITGSAGKTTTKDVIAAFLEIHSPVGKTVGNLNNHVGVPLSILRLPFESGVAVLEMGMNHAGEIAHLAAIAKPDIGVITNVGYAHIENFDSIEGIAAAKRELIDALPATGIAVLNIDDERVSKMAATHPGRTVTYGLSPEAGIRGEDVHYSLDGAQLTVNGVALETKLCGRHGASNLLAGIAVASLFDIQPSQLLAAAKAIEPGPMRGRTFAQNGILHFNDCYNSNPDAARAMLDLLADTPARRRIAVLGEMLELGSWSQPLHRAIGQHAAARGIDVLIGIRGAAQHTVESAMQNGLPARAAFFFDHPAAAGEALQSIAQPGDVILWKGSRGTRVELALERFLQ